MASVNFPSKYLLLPLNEMKKIKDKKYPHLDIKEVMKARRREKNKLHVKKSRERKKDGIGKMITIIKQQEERINYLTIENEFLYSIINK